nr:MBL fold metallo-hydrolase [Bacillota bacterium]
LNKLVLTTLLATIISLPLTLRINHSIGLVFLYANLFFILYISYVFLPASFILGFIPVFEPIYGFIAKVFETALVFFEKINYLLVLDFPTALHKAIFWGLIILILINRKQPKKMAVYLSMMIMLFIAMTMMPFESTVFVRFLDVGQGDAIHVHDHGCDLLIDTGDVDNHDQLINYFKSYNIHKLDTVIISHFHSDHYGELLDLAVAFDIGEIYVNRINIEVNVPYTVIKEGQKFTCGDSYFQVLSANNDDENENNNSIVLYAHIGSDRYLFSGDMESSVENQILESYRLEVDIIKVPHHGSITSSTEAFLEQINAKTAIISVGKENEYGLPDEEVIERYLAHGVDVFATSKEGTITVYYYRTVSLRVIETYRKQNLRHYHFSVM